MPATTRPRLSGCVLWPDIWEKNSNCHGNFWITRRACERRFPPASATRFFRARPGDVRPGVDLLPLGVGTVCRAGGRDGGLQRRRGRSVPYLDAAECAG